MDRWSGEGFPAKLFDGDLKTGQERTMGPYAGKPSWGRGQQGLCYGCKSLQACLKNNKEPGTAGTRAWEQSSRERGWTCWARQAEVRTGLLPRVKGGAAEVLGKEQVRSGSGLPRIPLASHQTTLLIRNGKPKQGADLYKITQDMGRTG